MGIARRENQRKLRTMLSFLGFRSRESSILASGFVPGFSQTQSAADVGIVVQWGDAVHHRPRCLPHPKIIKPSNTDSPIFPYSNAQPIFPYSNTQPYT
jgi:hypothetical protein